MAMTHTAREAALEALCDMRRRGVFAADALQKACEAVSDAREAALAYRLTLTVAQNRLLLDAALDAARSGGSLEPLVRDILRLGAAQLLFLRVPPHAAVSEAVSQARAACPRAAGLVNAVLRKIAGLTPEDVVSRGGGAPGSRAAIALRYSLPDWLTDELLARLSLAEVEAFGAATSAIRPVTLIENPLRPCGEAVGQPHPLLPGARLYDGVAARAPGFRDGAWLVADAAARAVVSALGVSTLGAQPGMRIWDACAAPGGKAFLAAMDMRGQGHVLATDISLKKLEKVRAGARRLGVENILDVQQADASEYRPDGIFDAVLCDVPCSGLGVLANKPDIRYKTPDRFERLPNIQRAILENAAKAVKPGGILVYATCTFRRQENEDVVDAFLADRGGRSSHPEFVKEGFALPFAGGPSSATRQEIASGEVTLWPHLHGTDGFYMCRMRKSSSAGGPSSSGGA